MYVVHPPERPRWSVVRFVREVGPVLIVGIALVAFWAAVGYEVWGAVR